ncbi:MAG: YHS domain-containing (seleno)protein [Sulfitobacter sp.]
MTRFTRRDIFALGSAFALTSALPAGASPVRIAVDSEGVAIDGYDTTAYWTSGAPAEGQTDHVVNWAGVPWRFGSAEDAEKFAATPDAFAPQFGGFCTRAMSFKKVVNGDPEVWRLYGDKLYLFAQPVGGTKFDEGQDTMIEKAQKFWDTLT